MATLTVRDAARRLNMKPSKVRELISEHKLTARELPSDIAVHERDRLRLDAEEVDLLARLRAEKRRARLVAATSESDDLPEQVAPLSGEIQLNDHAQDDAEASGRRMVALMQAMLAPLVQELHDSREVIRQQAEEVGVLRQTLHELEDRLSQLSAPAPLPQLPALASTELLEQATPLSVDREPIPAEPVPATAVLSGALASGQTQHLEPLPTRALPFWRRLWRRAATR